MSKSELEATFRAAWSQHGLGKIPKEEFKFHPVRKFRFDFAWPRQRVAVELDGMMGRHQTAKGMQRDHEKFNLAVEGDWLVFRYTARMLGSKKARREACQQVVKVLRNRTTMDMMKDDDLIYREQEEQDVSPQP